MDPALLLFMAGPVASTSLEVPPAAKKEIEAIESKLLQLDQVDCPLTHRFCPGAYLREIEMPAGAFIIGHEHKTEHFNIVLTGRAKVMMNGVVEEIVAPAIFPSAAGVRKLLYIIEPMRWATLHPTNETDLGQLEKDLIIKSDAFILHEIKQDFEKLRLAVEAENHHENA